MKLNIETIARAICQHGKCEKCDVDCIDYRAAERVAAVLEKETKTDEEESKDDLYPEIRGKSRRLYQVQ
jgi:hypothetical protein